MNNATEIDVRFDNQVKNLATLEKYKNTLKDIRIILNGVDLDKTSSQVKNTSSKITDLKNASKNMKKLNDNTNNTSKPMNKLGKNINLAFSVGKIIMFGKVLKNIGTKMWSLTEKSATYLENMNLLDVAYKGDTQEAKKFVNTLSEMYGLDESWGYRQVGIFKQLANAMGLSDEAGNTLAKTLTQLAIDTSSLYNIDVDETSQILQSGLAGQTKPVRRLGGDITMSTLQSTLDRNGIQKDISSLSYAEKRLVIVASILEQTKRAQGDWGRTIKSVANQQRIFQQQTERLSRALGNVFLPIVKTILPYLNGFLMALVEIVNWLAKLVGFKEEDYDFFGKTDTSKLLEDINGVDKGLASSGENAKKLKQGLRGFDKLNNITTPTTSGTGAGAGSGGGVSDDILDLFYKESDKYFKNLDKIEMKATKIKKAILNGLKEIKNVIDLINFEPLINSVINFGQQLYRIIPDAIIPISIALTNKIVTPIVKKLIEEWLPEIYNANAEILKQIDFSGIAKKYIKNFEGLRQIIEDIGDTIVNIYKLISKPLGKAINTISKLTTTIYNFAILKIKTSIHLISNVLGSIILAIQPIIDIIGTLLDKLSEIYDWVGNNIYPVIKSIFEDYITPLIDETTELYNLGVKIRDEFVGAVYNKLKDLLTKILEPAKKQIAEIYNNYIKPILKDVGEIYDKYFKPIFDKLVEIKNNIIGFIKSHVDDIGKAIEIMYTPIEKIVGFVSSILGFMISISPQINAIKLAFTVIKEVLEKFIIPKLKEVYNLFNQHIKPKIDIIVGKLKEMYNWINENIIPKVSDLVDYFNDMYNKYISPIVEKITEFKEKLDEIKSKTIKVTLDFIGKNIKTVGEKLGGALKSSLGGNLADLIFKANGGIFDGKKWSNIPQYAGGGLPSVGQIFVANERGAELVGHIGGQTFVANQKQVLGMMKRNSNNTSVNPTIIVQVGDKEVARQVISDLQDMASANGKPITIGAN